MLEGDGIVCRTVYAEVPPKVEYSPTERGESLRELIMIMRDWGRAHLHMAEPKRPF